MQKHDAAPSATRRAVVISPNSRMADELESVLQRYVAGVAVNRIRAYPSPRDMGTPRGGGASDLIFLDVQYRTASRRSQLLDEATRAGTAVQVVALLTGNDPDVILRCLRVGRGRFSDPAVHRGSVRGRAGQTRPPAAQYRRRKSRSRPRSSR